MGMYSIGNIACLVGFVIFTATICISKPLMIVDPNTEKGNSGLCSYIYENYCSMAYNNINKH